MTRYILRRVLQAIPLLFIISLGLFILMQNMGDPAAGQPPAQAAWPMILPVATLSFGFIAGYSRYIRSTMLESMGQDYIRTAKAKGLPRPEVVYVHALKNAALPIVTIVALDLPFLLGGAVVTERIFGWPGMGRLFLGHVSRSATAG